MSDDMAIPVVTTQRRRDAEDRLRLVFAGDTLEGAVEHACEVMRGARVLSAEIRKLNEDVARMSFDCARYRYLRDLACCSFTLSRDDSHACNYITAAQDIDSRPEWFADVPVGELQRMKDTNTVWELQVYPDTPVGFVLHQGATLDAAIDAAMRANTTAEAGADDRTGT